MSQSVPFNGTTYTIPQSGETGWGDQVTNWVADVSNNTATLTTSQSLTNKTLSNPIITNPTLTFGSDAAGDIAYYNGTKYIRLASGSSGQYLSTSGTAPNWATAVSNVGLALPNIFTVSNSPVTTTGTITASLATQTANLIFASPNGSSGLPAFRSIINADLPISGIGAGTYTKITFNNQGIATGGTTLLSSDVTTALGYTPVNPAGGTLTGALNEANPNTLTAASTVNIGAASSNTINISGTATITAFDTKAAGAIRRLVFAGVLTLTYNATSLILPSAANITTQAGDTAEFVSLGSGNWQCFNYFRADGSAITAGSTLPSQTGNSGKWLTTNGSSSSWATLNAGNNTQNLANDASSVFLTMGLTQSIQYRYNGFVDAFNDQSGINTGSSTAVYDPQNLCYASGNSSASFLNHFDNYSGAFVDSGPNAYLMTPTGVQTWTGFSKFGSGCAQFDGSTSKLTCPANNAAYKFAGDFCIEGWVFPTSFSGSPGVFTNGLSGGTTNITCFLTTGGGMGCSDNAGYLWGNASSGLGVISLNAWSHVAWVRSGSTVTPYLNGTSVGSATRATNYADGNGHIGEFPDFSGKFSGYIDCVRIVNGSPVYTSNFTPSTTALTAITNCTLLLQFDGSLTDSSTSGLTITNTNVALTPVPKIGTGCLSLGAFNSANYIKAPVGSFPLPGNFTVEVKVYLGYGSPSYCLFDSGANVGTTSTSFAIVLTSSTNVSLRTNAAYAISATVASLLNGWHDIAVIRNGSTITLYLDGVSIGTTSNATAFTDGYCTIGANSSAGNFTPGWMDEWRISNVARQTTNYTPSTTAFTSDANTLLLLHFDSLNNDVSTNLVPISYYGAPFANPVFGAACARFDGTASYLTGPNNNAAFKFAGDFTIECWICPTSFSGYNYIVDTSIAGGAPGIQLFLYTGTGALTVSNNAGLITGTIPPLGAWSHVALARSGTSLTLYLNGVISGSAATTSQNFSDGYLSIGRYVGGGNIFHGYIDDLRINNTTAVYSTSGFTVPSSPLTAITGTSLLLHFDGGATPFIDSSANNLTITNNGSPGVICVAPKFGTGAMWFDNSSNVIKCMNGPWTQFGTGNFTIDCWVYPSILPPSNGNQYSIFDTRNSGSTNGVFAYLYNLSGTQYIKVDITSGAWIQVVNSTLTAGSWHHLAYVRNGTTNTLYVDGLSVGSYTAGTSYTDGALTIGNYSGGGSYYFNGFIDEFRVLNGTAAWTAGFTPPSSQYSTNITLISANQNAANGNPTSGNCFIKYLDISTGSTLGTDIKVYMSRDGGTTFTEAATYANAGKWDNTYSILATTFDVSAQPANNTPVLKVATFNNKTMRLKGQSLYWS